MEGLTEGRIVHFVMPNGDHRPAIVVKVWSKENGNSNLQVFTDGNNDAHAVVSTNFAATSQVKAGLWWRTSVPFDEQDKVPGTWHWIEKA